jgi:catechol 2,3-dioxygenase-like lactoylglutathione lyase family enzyme
MTLQLGACRIIRMFERYTEKARRTIFFARYEASQFGSPYIETEFLLLGILRESEALSTHFFRFRITPESLRKEIAQHHPPRQQTSASVDIPLSNESKHVLTYAAEEADIMRHNAVTPEHLLLGIFREKDSSTAGLLQRLGVNPDAVRKLALDGQPAHAPSPDVRSQLGFFQLVLRVSNLDASVDFYTKLGFTPSGPRRPEVAFLQGGSCQLRLEQHPVPGHALSFVGVNVSEAMSRLESAGISFEKRPSAEGGDAAVLRDPDGNVISLQLPIRMEPPRA